jgi:predicted nucleic acid-binding protein
MIYLDACVLIYLIEGHERQKAEVEQRIAQVEAEFCISPMVKCECLVGPSRDDHLRLRQRYLTLFDQFLSLELIEAIYFQAAELRGRYGLRTPDALHLACAQHHGCDVLWTNDTRLARASRGISISLNLKD